MWGGGHSNPVRPLTVYSSKMGIPLGNTQGPISARGPARASAGASGGSDAYGDATRSRNVYPRGSNTRTHTRTQPYSARFMRPTRSSNRARWAESLGNEAQWAAQPAAVNSGATSSRRPASSYAGQRGNRPGSRGASRAAKPLSYAEQNAPNGVRRRARVVSAGTGRSRPRYSRVRGRSQGRVRVSNQRPANQSSVRQAWGGRGRPGSSGGNGGGRPGGRYRVADRFDPVTRYGFTAALRPYAAGVSNGAGAGGNGSGNVPAGDGSGGNGMRTSGGGWEPANGQPPQWNNNTSQPPPPAAHNYARAGNGPSTARRARNRPARPSTGGTSKGWRGSRGKARDNARRNPHSNVGVRYYLHQPEASGEYFRGAGVSAGGAGSRPSTSGGNGSSNWRRQPAPAKAHAPGVEAAMTGFFRPPVASGDGGRGASQRPSTSGGARSSKAAGRTRPTNHVVHQGKRRGNAAGRAHSGWAPTDNSVRVARNGTDYNQEAAAPGHAAMRVRAGSAGAHRPDRREVKTQPPVTITNQGNTLNNEAHSNGGSGRNGNQHRGTDNKAASAGDTDSGTKSAQYQRNLAAFNRAMRARLQVIDGGKKAPKKTAGDAVSGDTSNVDAKKRAVAQKSQAPAPAQRRPATRGASRSRDKGSPQERRYNKMLSAYKFLHVLGEGTFATVHKAVHRTTGLPVAIKTFHRSRLTQADDARVRREIKLLSKLRHPHVVRLLESVETPECFFLVMEFVPGKELFDYIVSKGRLHEQEACMFLHMILDGIDHCHQQGVVHRDLKLENLLIAPVYLDVYSEKSSFTAPPVKSGSNSRKRDQKRPLTHQGVSVREILTLKIVDFGLGNFSPPGVSLKTACGSPCYAAPEMIAGYNYVGQEVDMWSLGVVLYAMVYGYLPFEDENIGHMYDMIIKGNYQSPATVSGAVRDLISRLLKTDASQRFTAAQVRNHAWYRQQSLRNDPPWFNPVDFFRQPFPFFVASVLMYPGFPCASKSKNAVQERKSNDGTSGSSRESRAITLLNHPGLVYSLFYRGISNIADDPTSTSGGWSSALTHDNGEDTMGETQMIAVDSVLQWTKREYDDPYRPVHPSFVGILALTRYFAQCGRYEVRPLSGRDTPERSIPSTPETPTGSEGPNDVELIAKALDTGVSPMKDRSPPPATDGLNGRTTERKQGGGGSLLPHSSLQDPRYNHRSVLPAVSLRTLVACAHKKALLRAIVVIYVCSRRIVAWKRKNWVGDSKRIPAPDELYQILTRSPDDQKSGNNSTSEGAGSESAGAESDSDSPSSRIVVTASNLAALIARAPLLDEKVIFDSLTPYDVATVMKVVINTSLKRLSSQVAKYMIERCRLSVMEVTRCLYAQRPGSAQRSRSSGREKRSVGPASTRVHCVFYCILMQALWMYRSAGLFRVWQCICPDELIGVEGATKNNNGANQLEPAEWNSPWFTVQSDLEETRSVSLSDSPRKLSARSSPSLPAFSPGSDSSSSNSTFVVGVRNAVSSLGSVFTSNDSDASAHAPKASTSAAPTASTAATATTETATDIAVGGHASLDM